MLASQARGRGFKSRPVHLFPRYIDWSLLRQHYRFDLLSFPVVLAYIATFYIMRIIKLIWAVFIRWHYLQLLRISRLLMWPIFILCTASITLPSFQDYILDTASAVYFSCFQTCSLLSEKSLPTRGQPLHDVFRQDGRSLIQLPFPVYVHRP